MRRTPFLFLFLGLALVLCLSGLLPAQADQIQYRQFAWGTKLRRQLLEACLPLSSGSPDRLQAVAQALLENQEGVPFLMPTRALAVAMGVEADAGYLFRAGLILFAMPEVVDPSRFPGVAVTVYAPRSSLTGKLPMPAAGSISFQLRVKDAAGKEVYATNISRGCEISDLRQFRTMTKVPVAGLADGSYRVEVQTLLAGQGNRPQDLPLEVAFQVLKGFAERAGRFLPPPASSLLEDLCKDLAPLPRALLLGAADSVVRVYYGQPGAVPGSAVRDLENAERILQNIQAGRPPLERLSGWVKTGLPTGERGRSSLVLRLPDLGVQPDRRHVGDLESRPLVLFVPGVPAWDYADNRPSHPRFLMPEFLASALETAGYDREGRSWVAVLESPGRMNNSAQTLRQVLVSLPQILPVVKGKVILVGDRQGASCLASVAVEMPKNIAGLVLVNSSGSLAQPQLRRLGCLPILAIPGHGHAGVESIARLRYSAEQAGTAGNLRIPDHKVWPWSIALPLASPEIEAFVRQVSGQRDPKPGQTGSGEGQASEQASEQESEQESDQESDQDKERVTLFLILGLLVLVILESLWVWHRLRGRRPTPPASKVEDQDPS